MRSGRGEEKKTEPHKSPAYHPTCTLYQTYQTVLVVRSAAGLWATQGMPEEAEIARHNVDKHCAYLEVVSGLVARGGDAVSPEDAKRTVRNLLLDVTPLLQQGVGAEAVVQQLLSALLGLLNQFIPGSSQLRAMVEAALEVCEMRELLPLPLMTAACHALASIETMVRVVEKCVEQHFAWVLLDLSPAAGFGWAAVTDRLRVPELLYEDFVAACIERQCVLTLYAHVLQRQAAAAAGGPAAQAQEEERLAALLQQWVLAMGQVRPESGPRMLLLWGKVLELQVRVAQRGGSSQRLCECVAHLSSLAAKISEDRASGGLFGAIGLGAPSPHSLPLRLVCRMLTVFLQFQLGEGGWIRVPASSSPSKSADRQLAALRTLAQNRSYAPLEAAIGWAVAYITDPAHEIQHAADFLGRAAERVLLRDAVAAGLSSAGAGADDARQLSYLCVLRAAGAVFD